MPISARQRGGSGFGLSPLGQRDTRALPNTAVTAIDRENISVTLVSAPSSVAPGEMVEISVRVENTATSIPSDDPFFCRDRNGVAGVSLTVGGSFTLEGVGDPTPQIQQRAFCSTPGDSRLVTVSFEAPTVTGTYIGSVTAGWHDPPQFWGGTEMISIDITEQTNGGNGGNGDNGGNGENGGNGDQPPTNGNGDIVAGLSQRQLLIGLGAAGITLGGASILL